MNASAEHTQPADPSDAMAQPTGVLRLRGLPFAATQEDVNEFFQGYNLSNVLLCKRNGRSTGEAYVVLDPPTSAAEALEALNRKSMGHRYVEIFHASEKDMETAKSMSADKSKGFVIRLRGLPYTASAADVLRFFEGVDIVRGIEGVVFTYSQDGRATGEAYVEVQTEEAQKEAMKKHKEVMGTRYIELFISSKLDMIQAIQQNRMILGYASRKRWMQPPPMMGHLQQYSYMGGGAGRGMGGRGRRGYGNGYYNMDAMTNMFQGMNMRGQPQGSVQVIGPNGQPLPPGTYQVEVTAGRGTFMRGGRGMRGGFVQGGRQSFNQGPSGRAPYLGRGRGGRTGMQMQSMQQGRGAGRTGMQQQPLQQGRGSRNTGMQQLQQPQLQGQFQPALQQHIQQQPLQQPMQQYQHQQSSQQVLVQQPQYIIQQPQQQMQQVMSISQPNASGYYTQSQPGGGVSQGATYTLATIQLPSNPEYAQLSGGLQAIEVQHHQLPSGLQTVEIPGQVGGTYVEMPVSATLNNRGEVVLSSGGMDSGGLMATYQQ